jgi:hypothetical protein
VLLLGLTLPASAGSTAPAVLGDITITGVPYSLVPGAEEDNKNAILFIEQAGFILNSNVIVEADLPGVYSSKSSLTGGEIPADTSVSSFYLHTDPVATTGTVFTGSITFSSPIPGVIATSAGLSATDSTFANPSVVYAESDRLRGFELSPSQDQFSISPDLLTLSFTATTWDNVDDLRIITAGEALSNTSLPITGPQSSAPEPGTFLLPGLALVGVGWFRKGGKKSRSNAR